MAHTDPDGNGPLEATSDIFRYYLDGSLGSTDKAYGNGETVDSSRMYYLYDEQGRLSVTRDANRRIEGLTYYADGRVKTQYTLQAQFEYQYDAFGNCISKTTRNYDGSEVAGIVAETFRYDAAGNLIKSVNAYGDEITYKYDGMNLVKYSVEDDWSFVSDAAPDEHSKKFIETEQNPLGITKVTTSKGNTTTPTGATVKLEVGYRRLDPNVVGDPNYVTRTNYGPSNSSNSTENQYRYDAAGNVVEFTDVDGRRTTYEYDGFNRITKETIYPGSSANTTPNTPGASRTWDYDASGNLSRYTDRDGRVVVYAYDALGRKLVESAKGPGGVEGKNVFKYDQAGNLESAISYTFANNNYSPIADYQYLEYDNKGRATLLTQTITAPFGGSQTLTISKHYDDRLTSPLRSRTQSGYTVSAYEGDVRPVNGVFNAPLRYTNTYEFDAVGRETYAEQSYPQAGVAGLMIISIRTHYENASSDGAATGDGRKVLSSRYTTNRISESSNVPHDTEIVTTTVYERQDSDLIRSVTYSYDDRDLSETPQPFATYSYRYDAAGRLNGVSPAARPEVPAYNRVTSLRDTKTKDIAYDKEGHVESFTTTDLGSFSYQFVWQWGDRLALMKYGTTSNYFYYDAFGQLVVSHIDGVTDYMFNESGAGTLVYNSTASGVTIKRRDFNSSSGELLASQDATDASRRIDWALADGQGTVRYVYTIEYPGDFYTPHLRPINYDANGAIESLSTVVSAGIVTLARYRGAAFVDEKMGYYDGTNWSNPLIEGRTLSVVSSTADDRYNVPDRRQGTPRGFWSRAGQATFGAFQFVGGAAWVYISGGLGAAVGGGLAMYSGADDIVNAFGDGPTRKAQWAQLAAREWGGVTSLQQLDTIGAVADIAGGMIGGAGASAGFKVMSQACLLGVRTAQIRRAGMLAFGAGLGLDAVGATIGGMIGHRSTGTLQGAVDGANFGMLAVGLGSMARSLANFKCYPLGTPVATEHGPKSIEQIRSGELVWAFDLAEAEWVLRPVVETYEFDYEGDYVELTIDGRPIESTFHHPYWVIEGVDLEDRPRPDHVQLASPKYSKLLGRWVDAGDMLTGDIVLLRDGRQVPVEAISLRPVAEKVYNLQVRELHNYAVGTQAVLAHNMCALAADRRAALDEIVARHGGRRLLNDANPNSYSFPSKHAAKQAASEIAGDLGRAPIKIPQSAYREAALSWSASQSKKIIGKHSQALDEFGSPAAGYHDHFLGHSQFYETRGHFNAWGRFGDFKDNIHLFYGT